MAKLLLLDDEPDALLWMVASLTGIGHQVRAYTNGRSALESLDTWRPDLILSDILMPEMDGLAFARLVRAHGDPPVMFISIAVKQAEAILAGAVGYVQKPATANEVREAVKEVLGHPQRRATIMIVDDDYESLDLYVHALTPSFDVVRAHDGLDALDQLTTHHIDLVITDFHMPNMNGLELIRALRANPAYERLPVIVQTSDRLALTSPAWRDLNVSYKIDKFEFLRWLRHNIDAKLPARTAAVT